MDEPRGGCAGRRGGHHCHRRDRRRVLRSGSGTPGTSPSRGAGAALRHGLVPTKPRRRLQHRDQERGSTLARNVRFTFSPEWESSDAERNKIKDSKLWREGIATLVPGQEIAILADMFPDRYKRTDLPTAYEVEVRYEGVATRSSGSRAKAGPTFVLNYTLDFEVFYGYNQAQLYGLHEVADAVRQIRARLDSWSESPSGRLSVVARDGDEADLEERREFDARRQRLADERRARPTPTPQDVVPVEGASSAFVAEEPVDRGAAT